MRGNVLMWSGDKGVVSSGGQRYDFTINQWRGDTAPAANATVDIEVANGQLVSVKPVNESDLAKEKMAELTGKGGVVAKAVFENVGKDVAIAYGVFLVAALFMSIVSTGGFISCDIKLADALGGEMAMAAACLGGGSSGGGVFMILIAAATIAVPYFWKHKFAPLAFVVPLLVVLKAFWPMYDKYREQQKAMEAMGEFGQQLAQLGQQMGAPAQPGLFDSFSFGAWIIIAAALYLAFRGVTRFLASR